MTEPTRAASTASIDATGTLTDSITNYETIKAFGAEPRMNKRMEVAYTATEGHWARFLWKKLQNGIVVATIFAGALGISVFVAAIEVQRGNMSVGEFVLVNAYMLQLFTPVEQLGFATRDIAHGMAFIEKMLDVLRREGEPASRLPGKRLPDGPGELTVDRINFSYGGRRSVLHDVSFRVPGGDTVALVGNSGSGKSSLIRLLLRFWEPDSGKIEIDGVPIFEVSASNLRAEIAIVPQDTVLFNDTIAFNIAVGGNSSNEDIEQAARVADIHDFIVAQPDGYETGVGERGLKLSGGEKQRIAIARAVLRKPRVFVLDEATSSLDSRTEQTILRNMRDVAKSTTTLVIAHRLSTVVEADEIVVLENGRVVERGTHRELLQRQGIYRRMWRAQHREDTTGRAVAV